MFGTMFRNVQQVKIPLIQPYLSTKFVSIRTQPHPKTLNDNEEPRSVQSECLGHPPALGTFLDAFLKNDSLPCNAVSGTKISEFMEGVQQYSAVPFTSTPCRTKIHRRSCTDLDEISDFRLHSVGVVRNNVATLSERNRNSHGCVNFVNQYERLSLNHYDTISSAQRRHVLQYSSGNKPSKDKDQSGRPSEEQLLKIHEGLAESIPKFFYASHNYALYNQNIVFHNNISGVTKRGMFAYASYLSVIRILGTLKYTNTKMNVLKVTNHPEDGTVRVRWRISGISGMKPIYTFWKFRPSNVKNNKEEEWTDGFSVFYIGSDGLIYKHVCDKIMPDDNVKEVRPGSFAVGLG